MDLYVCQYSGYAAVPPGLRWMRGGFACAPCLANCGGGSCRGFACCLVVGCFACGAAEERPCDTLRALPENVAAPVRRVRGGFGGLRSDIRVPEAKRGRVPL